MKLSVISRRLRRHAEVALAAWRGFRYRLFIGAPVVREGFSLFWRLLWWRNRDRTSFTKWRFRIRQCRGCDIYDPIHKACGNNQGVLAIGTRLYPSGCSCLVGVKSSSPKSDCTLETFGLASRWASFGVSLDGVTAASEADASERIYGTQNQHPGKVVGSEGAHARTGTVGQSEGEA